LEKFKENTEANIKNLDMNVWKANEAIKSLPPFLGEGDDS